MVKISDPRVVGVAVEECNEPMVNLMTIGRWYLWSQVPNVKEKTDFGDCEFPVARVGLVERMKKVFSELPQGWGLFLDEPYRSYEYQRKLYKEAVARGETDFVSNPDVYSPHVTGGAIDLAIVDDKGLMIDVGNWFDYDETAHTYFEEVTDEQKKNRQMLIDLMTSAGFVNYPYEWWHWSYGDKYWGFVTGNKAIYGQVKHP